MENIFLSIFEEAAAEPTHGIKEHVKIREGKQFWEDNKRWQENDNLTPIELLNQIIHNNKLTENLTGYESI
jgi:predicted DNA-binding ribbon-helix-helix protein